VSCQTLLVTLDALGRPKAEIRFFTYNLRPSVQFLGYKNLMLESIDFGARKNRAMDAGSYVDP
jgi:hypothetical protein